MIEAINKKAELAGELAYQQGLMNYNSSIKEYYSDILDRIFNLYLQEINVNVANLQLKSAQITYDNNSELFNRGLISSDDLKVLSSQSKMRKIISKTQILI